MVDRLDRLGVTRYQLNRTAPFLAHLVNSIPMVFSPNIPTACCTDEGNCGKIYLGETFMDSLTQAQFNLVVLHEVMHLALGVFSRKGNRNPQKWNFAHDYFINWTLTNWPSIEIEKIEGMLLNSEFANMAAEEIYTLIPDPPKMPSISFQDLLAALKGESSLESSLLDCISSNKNSEEVKNMEDSLRRLLQEAIMQEEMRGKGLGRGFGPGGFGEWVKSIIRPKISWREMYQHILNGHLRGKSSSWLRPSKKSEAVGVLMPGHRGKNLPEIWFVADSSGSISSEDFKKFVGASAEVCDDTSSTCRLIQVDTCIHSDEIIEDFDTLKLKRVGMGGTSFKLIPSYIKKQDSQPNLVILFTDGYADWPEFDEWPCDILVVTTGGNAPEPYKTVKLES